MRSGLSKTKIRAQVWFHVDDEPVMRRVYTDGHDWWVNNPHKRKMVRIDSASGWVLVE